MFGGRKWTIGTLRLAAIACLCLFLSTNAFAQQPSTRDGGFTDTKVSPVKIVPDGPLPQADQRRTAPSTSIVGGTVATPGEYPWQARVYPSGYTIYCGGSLISTQWVLTAAHCVDGTSASSFRITLGDHNVSTNEGTEQTFNVTQIIMHPSYNSNTQDNDLALMKLSGTATLNSRVQTIPLATSSDSALFAPGVYATVTGWGATSQGGSTSNVLREVQVPIVSNTTCNASNAYNGQITGNMICAGLSGGGKDSCQGDSGGPFIVPNGAAWKLAGIVSWGEGCAKANKYGVYTRVANYTSWISGYVGTTPNPTPGPTATPNPVPTATPPPSGGNTIANGGFESGTSPWVQSSSGGYGLIDTSRPHSGSYSAYLGGYNSGSDKIYQTITVPGGSALKYSYYISTQETGSTAYDYLRVRVYSTSGTLLGTLKTYSNASTKNSWVTDSASLASYAGQTVRIQFEASTDYSLTTTFFVDNVSTQ